MLKVKVITSGFDELQRKLAQACSKAEHTVATTAEEDTKPFVPMLTGSMDERTKVLGNAIIYPAPYARYLYYGKVMVNIVTGKGPMHYVDKNGNEQIKFPPGSRLKPTNRNLKINKTQHRQAQAHWFEASKAQNMDKWIQKAKEEVEDEI